MVYGRLTIHKDVMKGGSYSRSIPRGPCVFHLTACSHWSTN